MSIEVKIVPLPVQRVMSVRKAIPGDASIADRFDAVFSVLGPNLPPLEESACVALYYAHPSQGGQWDLEIGMTVPSDYQAEDVTVGDETVTVHDLPPVAQAASYRYKGPYEGIGQQWTLFMEWLAANGYQPSGPGREIYVNSPEDTAPEDLLTEIQSPVIKVN